METEMNINDILSSELVKVRTEKKEDGKIGFYFDIQLENGKDFNFLEHIASSERQKNTMSVVGLLQARSQRKLQEGKTSIARQLKNVITHLQCCGTDVTLDKLDRQWCLDFLQSLKKHPKESTQRNYFLNLNASLNEAVSDGILNVNPFDKVPAKYKPRKQRSSVDYLEAEEVRSMLETVYRPDIKEFFKFLCYSGMRYSDAIKLSWEDIRYVGKGFDCIEFRTQKTGRDQSVYVPSDTLPAPRTEGRVFSLPDSTGINRHLKKWARLAGIRKNVHLHTARHTFATQALTQGVDLYTISKLLGHTSINTTQIYADVMDKKKEEAAVKMRGIF